MAKMYGAKDLGIILSCDEAITRIEAEFATRKKRLMNILIKKRE